MRTTLATLLLSLTAAGALSAQSGSFDAQGSLVVANDALLKVTRAGSLGGLALGLGYTTSVRGSQIPIRYSLNAGLFPGKPLGTVKTDLSLLQLAADVHIATGFEKLAFTVGMSLNQYRLRNSGAPSELMSDLGNPNLKYYRYDWAVTQSKGLKGGVRLGLDYPLSSALTATALFQMTELGTGSYGGINPSWIELGARWRF